MTDAPPAPAPSPRRCRWACPSCRFEYTDDWSASCTRCGAPAPLSARRIGIKLRGLYFLCTLSLPSASATSYGRAVAAVNVKTAQQHKFLVARDDRPIDEQLTEGLDREVHGRQMAATIQVSGQCPE